MFIHVLSYSLMLMTEYADWFQFTRKKQTTMKPKNPQKGENWSTTRPRKNKTLAAMIAQEK